MNKKAILIIAKKEFLGFVNSVLAYVIIIPFLLIASFLYFRTALVVGEASLRPYFELMPWFLLFLAPALSMQVLSEEQKKGTLELLFGHPLSEMDIVLGKFFGVLSFYILILITTLSLPLTLMIFSKPDLGIVFSQYLGVIFLGAAFISIGVCASAWVKSSIGSFLGALSLSFVFILIGFDIISLMLPWPINLIIGQIAIIPHVSSISRGVLDIRDLLYFATLTIIFLILAIFRLSKWKIAESKKAKIRLNIALAVIIAWAVAINVFLQKYPWRLDLTKNKLFTLSKGAKSTLQKLPDKVTINVYASRSLPSEVQMVLKEVEDLLKDFKRYGDKLEIKIKQPDIDSQALEEAQKEGIQEVTFNKIGASKFETQNGFFGLTIKYKDKTETIAFIENTQDLEYQLTRRIRKLTADKEQIIGIYNNDYMGQYQFLNQVLETQYQTKMISLDEEEPLKDISGILLIDSASGEEATFSAVLGDYLKNHGKALVLTKGVLINPQILSVAKSGSKIIAVLKDYGITINNDLVYDLELNEPVTLGQGNVRYLLPYPFWLKSLPASKDFGPLNNINSILLTWPSSIDLEEKQDISYVKVLQTGLNAGLQKDNFNISPNELKSLEKPLGKNILLSVGVQKDESKLAVITDYNFVSDNFGRSSQENFSFLSGLIDWLLADKEMEAVTSKLGGRQVFRFTDPRQAVMVQYGNIIMPPLLVISFAIFWLSRRKKLTLRKYSL